MIIPGIRTSRRKRHSVAFVIVAAFALASFIGGAAAQGVDPAFDTLVRSLSAAREPGGAARRRVERDARALEDAIQTDGGARKALMDATHNIVASLHDGSFSAERSLQALQSIAPHAVIDPGPWRPGPLYPRPVGVNLHQKGEGDCVGISALKAFSTTPSGAAILRRAVARDASGGGYAVNLPGAPARVFHIKDAALDQYGLGDPAAAAIVGALFQYFGLDPRHAALPTNKVMELLAGARGHHHRLADTKASPAEIERYLIASAPRVGVDVAMVFGGRPAHGGDWSRGDGHAFAVLRIDRASRTVFYTNPWNEGRVRSIAIRDLASQAAGTSADFETITFPGP